MTVRPLRPYSEVTNSAPIRSGPAPTPGPNSDPAAVSTPAPGGGREQMLVRSVVPLLSAYILLMSLLLSGNWILQGLVEERSKA